jgi:hypothetical protein
MDGWKDAFAFAFGFDQRESRSMYQWLSLLLEAKVEVIECSAPCSALGMLVLVSVSSRRPQQIS